MLLKFGEEALTALHVCAWSQVGVLLRIYLELFFTNGCSGSWGLCLLSQGGAHRTFGAYFPDLAANMLGSFIMGVLTSASALGAESTRALAILPEDHVWQDTPELLVGLRTGFCGSLTTFASWELSLVQLLIGGRGYEGGQWDQFLWGLVIGFQASLSSYMFGAHLAANLDALILGQRPLSSNKRGKAGLEEGKKATAGSKVRQKSRQGVENGDQQLQPSQGPPDAGWDMEERGQVQQGEPDEDGWAEEEHGMSSKPSDAAFKRRTSKFRKTHAAVLLMLTLLTALWIVLAILDNQTQHLQRRKQWFALLFAPFGAMLRWKLALLNGSITRLTWFPAGTLAANLTACCIDFGTQAGLQRMTSPGYWVTVLLKAVQLGFSGALSTVSTFVAEVHAMPGEKADNIHGYIYGFLSVALGALTGVVIYGWSIWA